MLSPLRFLSRSVLAAAIISGLVPVASATPKAQVTHQKLPKEKCSQLSDVQDFASKVRIFVDPKPVTQVLDAFNAKIELPLQEGQTLSDVVGITVAVSANGILEPVDDLDLREPGEASINGVDVVAFQNMQRLIMRFDPKEAHSGSEIAFKIRPLNFEPITLSWAMISPPKNGCPSRQLGPISQVTYQLAQNSASSCEAQQADLKNLLSAVSITLDASDSLAVGEAITVNWKRGPQRFPLNNPSYIVFSMPDWLRFEGHDIVAVPRDAPAPGKISYGSGRMRVFVPLHMRGTHESGSFKITPFRAASLQIEYSVVSKTSCGEQVILDSTKFERLVAPGRPQVMIQDSFALDKPNEVILSNDNKYRLEIFDTTYRVYDESGVLIIERAGRLPNFSPTARFLAATADSDPNAGNQIELIDLVAEKTVNFELHGPILGWADGDAILIEGTYPHGELKIRQTFIDPVGSDPTDKEKCAAEYDEPGLIVPTVSAYWRDSSAWESLRFRLDVENGIVLLVGPFGATTIWELATGLKLAAGKESLPLTLKAYHSEKISPPLGWDTIEPLKLSHYSPLVDDILPFLFKVRSYPDSGFLNLSRTWIQLRLPSGKLGPRKCLAIGSYAVFPDKSDSTAGTVEVGALQKTYLVEHHTVPTNRVAIARPVGDWRTKLFTVEGVPLIAKSGLESQLESFGISLDTDARTPESFVVATKWSVASAFMESQTPVFTVPAAKVEKDLLKAVPSADQFINTLTPDARQRLNNEHFGVQYDPRLACSGPAGSTHGSFYAWRFQEHAHGVWTWKINQKTYWLVQMLCVWKGVQNTKLYLFVKLNDQRLQVIDLFDPLLKSMQSGPTDTLTRVRPQVVENRWLLIASAGAGAAALVDLERPDRFKIIRGMRNAAALQQLFLSNDRSAVLQLNTNGALYLYSVETATTVTTLTEGEGANDDVDASNEAPVIIQGRWIDNEVLLYTMAGYYWGSYEAGHFVNLRLPGVAALYSINQFASTLYRPDIVRSTIKGQKSPDAPRLSPPPTVSLQTNSTEDGKLHVVIGARAATSLKFARVFIDGQLVLQLKLTGAAADADEILVQPAQGRVVSAIAFDSAGLTSAVVSKELRPRSGGGGRLLGLTVGVEHFKDKRLDLNYAASDAKRVRDALSEHPTGYYRDIQITPLLDNDASAGHIITEVETLVSEADQADTVLFFFSGHGLKGADGLFYLASSGISLDDPAGTGLAWARIATALRKSKARVIVILDACHAGLSGIEEFSSNEQVASELTSSEVPMLILAAAKSRQVAYEDNPARTPRWAGGVFSSAIVDILGTGRMDADKNHDGVLELSEFYGALKKRVVSETEGGEWGSQTPWIERNIQVGDYPLF